MLKVLKKGKRNILAVRSLLVQVGVLATCKIVVGHLFFGKPAGEATAQRRLWDFIKESAQPESSSSHLAAPILAPVGVIDYFSWEEYGGSSVAPEVGDCFIWFVPDWLNVWGGGHFTLFRFADFFSRRGVRNILYIYDNLRHKDGAHLESELRKAIPGCRLEVIVSPRQLPKCRAAFATTWQSAYNLRAFPFAKNKFYFMQDYESYFYGFGTKSLQANKTYEFGFTGITSGKWLRGIFEGYGGKALDFTAATDKEIFFPGEVGGVVRPKVKRVFFYGRPSTERRCYELGITALAYIAKRYPDVEILIAGLDLSDRPPFRATLLGNLTLKETGELYRTCDIGIAFSGTNLSYLPIELMASGVPLITNGGPHVEWYCLNERNCLIVDPVARAVMGAFDRLYVDASLRQRLAAGGLSTAAERTWEGEMDHILNFVDEVCRGNLSDS